MAYRYTGTTKQKQSPKRKSTIGGSSNIKSSKRISWKFAAPLIAIVALVGGYTVFRSFAAEPAIPQNGKLLVFKADDHGFKWTAPNSGLFLIGEDESPSSSNSLAWATDKRLISPGSSRTGISPDGKRLAYLEQAAEVHLAHSNIIDGSQNERPVTIPGYGSQGANSFKWSPSNNYIAYVHSMGGNEQRLHVTSTDGEENIDISGTLPVPENHKLREASPQFFFHDDSLVLYATFDPVDSTIPYEHTKRNKYFRVNIHDKTAVELIPEQGFDSSEKVLSSRGEIAQWRYGSNEVLIYKLENSRFVRMRSFEISETGGHHQGLFHWSPDGTKLAINSSIYNGSTGDLLSKINDGFVILGWQSLPPAAEPIPTKKPSEPTPPETPTKTNTQIVTEWYYTCLNRAPDSAGLTYWKGRLDKGESAASVAQAFMAAAKVTACNYPAAPPTTPPPAPTTYTEDATKLVVPANTPYIQRITSPSKYIIIKPQAYTYQKYISFADKTAVTNFLKTQQAANKKVKVCVVTRTSPYTSMLMLRKLSGSTTHNITIAKNALGKKHCTSAITITSTMTSSPIMQVATAQAGDVLIDSASIEIE